ncbi:HlyD family type I secretion periplasmic adaptor subunit [Azohydromonas aeria]|uniref:HlyD family type I secretion periplasmic adaptor subunit n=1 Tax=Azohydromonas aeria TaxID=2590212 RepID=UPI0012FA16DC|nr:HlyD family type I secretion periplasmic adaptor subunit [Azohydromonas aeria]
MKHLQHGLPGRRGARGVIALSLVTVTGFVGWAQWAELDQIARAAGQVIPSGRVQVVQSADAGVVAALNVREGDRVRRGQLLVRLDRVKAESALNESRAKAAALRGAVARLEAEVFERPLNFPAEVAAYPAFVANQRALHAQRRAALHAEVAALQQSLKLVREELAMNEPLLATGDVSRAEVLKLQRQAAELEGQITNRRNKYLQDAQTELAKAQEDLAGVEQVLTQRRDQLGYTELTAPADGIVKNVRYTTVGAVVRAGDEVLQIVPTGDELIVEAKVRPADIGFVRVGQPATVKFDAYDYAVYGVAHGQVTYISADTLTENQPQQEQPYYRVHVRASVAQLQARPGERVEIQPGMTASAEIRTGQSTVWRYLTKPLTKTLSESMGER